MIAVVADTNIFLRFLTKDVPDRAKLVVNRFIQAQEEKIDLVDLLTWTLSQETKRKILSFDKHYDQLNPKLRLEP